MVFIQRKEDYGLRFLVGSRDKAISCLFLSILTEINDSR